MFNFFKSKKPDCSSDRLKDRAMFVSPEDLKRTTFDEAIQPKETIEGMLKKFDDAGADRPNIVITGKKMVMGHDNWTAKIDGEAVTRRFPMSAISTHIFYDLESIECKCVRLLKRRLSQVVTDITTITYE